MIVDTAALTLTAFGETFACVIGHGGVVAAADKREGDGATPLGVWPLRCVLLRPPFLHRHPRAGGDPISECLTLGPRLRGGDGPLPWRWLRPGDGWSDDPRDPAYNRPVRHPHGFSAEHLWRDDEIYDTVIVLGYNDAPPVPGRGSAIYLHLARPDRRPTEGCVALAAQDMARLRPRLTAGMTLTIT